MNPLPHATHTIPASREQAGDNGEPPIAHLPDEVFAANILPYLGPKDLSHASQVCRRFNVLSHTVWQQRARAICRACAELLSSFGIMPLGADSLWQEAVAFLDRTVQRVREIQNSLPGDLRPQFSTNDLVCTVDPAYMLAFLQTAYDHSLRTMFGRLAHISEGASLEESVRRIREWLQTAGAREVDRLDRWNCQLCCLPREIGQLTALQWLNLGDNRLASLPQEIGQLTALQVLGLASNRLASLPREIGRLTALRRLYLRGNRLASLPPEIGQLMALRWLYLRGNPLTFLLPEMRRPAAL